MNVHHKVKKRAKFIVEGGALYIANDGRGFDRLGIIALSITNLSTKTSNETELPVDTCKASKDVDWVGDYGERRLKLLSDDQNQLVSEKRGEEQYSRDYAGRWLFETLQNIDDALGSEDSTRYIGTKGLGFLSIFEIGDYVQIFSGNFEFEFSAARTSKALIEAGISEKKAANAPKLFVPWPTKADGVVTALKKDGYETVIKVNLKDKSGAKIFEEIENLEPYFLLLSQNIEILAFEIEDYHASYQRQDEQKELSKNIQIQDIKIRIQVNKENEEVMNWRRWLIDWDTGKNKRASCAVCLPTAQGKPIPMRKQLPIYNFYPTEEPSETFALIHATFELSANRKSLQMHGEEKQWNSKNIDVRNTELIRNLYEIINHLCFDSSISIKDKLQIFKNIGKRVDKNESLPRSKIKSVIAKALRETKFVPTVFSNHKILIKDIVFWQHELVSVFDFGSVPNKLDKGDGSPSYTFFLTRENNNLKELFSYYNSNQINWETQNFYEFSESRFINFNNEKVRENFFKNIEYYGETTFLKFDEVKNLPILKTNDNELKTLEDVGVIFTKKLEMPSFLIPAIELDKFTIKNLGKLIKADFYSEYFFKADLKKLLVNNHEENIRNIAISDERIQAINAHENFNQYEFLEYLHRNYTDSIASNTWEKIGQKIEFQISKNENKHALSDLYFSKSWVDNNGLNLWLDRLQRSSLKIPSKSKFKKELEHFSVKYKNEKKNKIFLFKLLTLLGIKRYPSPEVTNSNHHTFLNAPLRTEYESKYLPYPIVYISRDFYVPYFEEFVNDLNHKETVYFILNCLRSSSISEYSYGIGPRGGSYINDDNKFRNFLRYQLYNVPWVKVAPSIINPSGLCNIESVYLNSDSPVLYPEIDLSFLTKKEKNLFLSEFNLKIYKNSTVKDFSDLYAINYKYLKFRKRYPNKTREAGVSLENIYNSIHKAFSKEKFSDLSVQQSANRTHYPAFHEGEFPKFDYPRNLLFNDLGLGNELAYRLSVHVEKDLCLFDERVFSQNIPSDFNLLSNVIGIVNNSAVLSDEKLRNFCLAIKERWDIICAIAHHSNKPIYNYTDLLKDVVLCENIHLTLNELNSDKYYFDVSTPDISNYLCTSSKKLYISVGNDIEDLCGYLKTKFQISSSFIEGVFVAEGKEGLDKLFKKENLPPNIIESYELLGPSLKARETLVNDSREASNIFTEQNASASESNPKPGIRSKRTSAGRSPNLKSGNKKIGIARARFGTPVANDTEAQKVGDAGEILVEISLIQQGFQKVERLGGNNKGFDIQYYDSDNQRVLVEVKSFKNTWEGSHVTMSSSQFEYARENRENYWLYIVEHALSDEPNILKICDPHSFFSSLELDSGWKDFVVSVENGSTPLEGLTLSIFSKEEGRWLEKGVITHVDNNGRLYRLKVGEDSRFITFIPNKMRVE